MSDTGTPNSLPPLRSTNSFATESLALVGGEVRVWVIRLDARVEGIPDPLDFLTDDERTRAERYKVEKARHQFVTGRSLLRYLLGTRLGVAPREVQITYTGAGKPVLADTAAGLHFNVTHTDGLALIAFGTRPLGIDVERVRALANPEGLVARFFSPAERDAFLHLPEELRPAGFFRGWTCKEAVIKAAGLSVAYLDEFDVELHPMQPAKLLAARHPVLCGSGWGMEAWEPLSGFAAAVVMESARSETPGAISPDQTTRSV
jgi:4'-phosphopantetheinyl transferase